MCRTRDTFKTSSVLIVVIYIYVYGIWLLRSLPKALVSSFYYYYYYYCSCTCGARRATALWPRQISPKRVYIIRSPSRCCIIVIYAYKYVFLFSNAAATSCVYCGWSLLEYFFFIMIFRFSLYRFVCILVTARNVQ